jgi:hypothetical protein
MNVIRRAVYDQSGCMYSAHDAAQVGEQIIAEHRRDQRVALNGAENQMENYVS